MPRKLRKLSLEEIASLVVCDKWSDRKKIRAAMRGKKYLDVLDVIKSSHVPRIDRLWIVLQIVWRDRFSFPGEVKRTFADWYVKNWEQLVPLLHPELDRDSLYRSAEGNLPARPMYVFFGEEDFATPQYLAAYNKKVLRKLTSLIEKWLEGKL